MERREKYSAVLRHRNRKCAMCGRLIIIGNQVVAYVGIEEKIYGRVVKCYRRVVRFHPSCDPEWSVPGGVK